MPRRKRPIVSDFELEPRLAPANSPPALVRDINPANGPASPNAMAEVNGILYFAAETFEEIGLWRSNGTSAGTTLVRGFSELPAALVNVGGTLYFRGYEGATGYELWKSNGTSTGTTLVRDIRPGSGYSNPTFLTNVGGTLFFQANDGTNGRELWKSDGTSTGTTLVRDIGAGSYSGFLSQLTNHGGTLYFRAFEAASGYELWASDGTNAGTRLVHDTFPGNISGLSNKPLVPLGGALYFAASDGVNGLELWRSNGASTGTSLVIDLTAGSTDSAMTELVAMNGTIFISSGELFKSDGTSAGTVLVRDILPGAATSFPRKLTNAGGTLFFSANVVPAGNQELWKSDGTSSGTVLVRTFPNPGLGSEITELTNVGGTLFFRGFESGSGYEVWKSNGASTGTVLVRDINTSGFEADVGGHAKFLTAIGGTLFLQANDGVKGAELWKTDGTFAGTVLVRDINTFAYSSSLSHGSPIVLNGAMIFGAQSKVGFNTGQLWRSDGTSAGTSSLVTTFNSPGPFAELNGLVYFPVHASDRLGRSDGTAAGSGVAAIIDTGGGSGTYMAEMTNVNGTLFFRSQAGDTFQGKNYGRELVKSDGTSAGTGLVRDIFPGISWSYPSDLVNMNGTLYFNAIDATDGPQLWRSDGSSGGTFMVSPPVGGQSTGANPNFITNVNGTLYFRGSDSAGTGLWRSDGTPGGTFRIHSVEPQGAVQFTVPPKFVQIGNDFYFPGKTVGGGTELWKSDGTSSGTTIVRDIFLGAGSSAPGHLYNHNGTLYFSANNGSGTALWKSNGTFTGTVMVRAIAPGSPYAEGKPLFTSIDSTLFFAASDGVNGSELWRSDGTSAGTTMIDLEPGVAAYPFNLAAIDNRLLFFAHRSDVGNELFSLLEGVPFVAGITSTSTNGSYNTGQSVNVQLNFNEPVTLANGNLSVTLDTGAILTIAPFTGTSASATYVVQAGQTSADLNVTNLSLAAGATLRNAALVDVSLALPASNLAVNKNLLINLPNTAPTISGIADQSALFGAAIGPLALTVGDLQSLPASLTLSAGSSNPTLVPVGNIVFGGSGANRNVTITPAVGQSGTSTITLTVSDGGLSTPTSFLLTGQPNSLPTIGDIADQVTVLETAAGPIPFSVGDLETASGSLLLSAKSSNPTLVPTGSIVFGGSGANRTVALTPAAGQLGTSTITITVTDGGGATAQDTFVLTVNDSPPTISDIPNKSIAAGALVGPLSFTIGDKITAAGNLLLAVSSSNEAVIPPSAISVSGIGPDRSISVQTQPGLNANIIITVTVTDGGGLTASDQFTITQTIPNSPPTISDIADQGMTANTTLGPLPFTVGDTQTPLNLLVLSATSSNPALIPNAKVVFGGSGADRTVSLAPFAGQTGATTITITVRDQGNLTAVDTFLVTVVAPNAPPTISDITNRSTPVDTPVGPINFTIGDAETPVANLTLSVLSSNESLIPLGNVIFGGSGASRNLTIAPAAGLSGTSTITVIVTDGGSLTAQDSFDLTVTVPPNTPPTISNIASASVSMNGALAAVPFTIGDAQTLPANLTLSVQSSNPALVPVGNVVFGGSGATRSIAITPAADKSGTSKITVTVTDGGGLTAQDNFDLTVTNSAPTIGDVANQSMPKNAALGPVGFTVGDAETLAANLVLSASSSNPALVPLAGISFGGGGADRTISIAPAANQFGSSTITITAADVAGLTATDTFTLTVSPIALPPKEYSVGRDAGGPATVRFFNPNGSERFALAPFGASFTGGVRTAAADFTGDGVADLAVASGPGRGGQVLVYDGVSQKLLFDFVPFGPTFTRGILVAGGDLNNDGRADLVITAEQGGGARMRVFQSTGAGFNQRADFFGLVGGDGKADVNFRGGSRGGVADINGDGTGDLVFAAGAGGGPRIAIFDGKLLAGNGGPKLTGDFFALSPALRDGAFIGGGDFNNDGKDDLVAGGGSGAPPQVVIFNGAHLILNQYVKLADFHFGTPTTKQGVRVAVKNLDNDHRADLILGSAPTAGNHVSGYAGSKLAPGPAPTPLHEFDAFPGFSGGVFVG